MLKPENQRIVGLGKGRGYDVHNERVIDTEFSAEPQDPHAAPKNTGGYHPGLHGPLKGEKEWYDMENSIGFQKAKDWEKRKKEARKKQGFGLGG